MLQRAPFSSIPVAFGFYHWLLLAALVFGVTTLSGQTFTVLYNFSETVQYSNWDGAAPYHSGVVVSGNRLYGCTYEGGTNGNGTLFSVNADTSDFSVLHTFAPTAGPSYTNVDGANPSADLMLEGDTLYGTAAYGGTNGSGCGTLFSVKTNGTSFSTLHHFNNIPDGQTPQSGLQSFAGTLYGAASQGGATNGRGTLFSVDTDGSSFNLIHTFTVTSTNYPYTNTDGGFPFGNLLLSGDTLYGTATYVGAYKNGTVFSIKTNGTGFQVLHTFGATSSSYKTNVDGAFPESGLVMSGDTLYGVATFGGANNRGTIFSMKTNGSDFTVLHTFTDLSGSTNEDGAYPVALARSGTTLYGGASSGGAGRNGTIFSINTDGSGFATLHAFSSGQFTNLDGKYPQGIAVIGNKLFGTTEYGGAHGNGTVFMLSIPTTLYHESHVGAVILSWNDSTAILQAASDLAGPYTNKPNATSPYTNNLADPQKFFRLLLSH